MLKIGSLSLDVPFFQAPLSGYTDTAMRNLARKFGCPLTYTGMMLDRIALHPRAIRKLKFLPNDDIHPVGAQIIGKEAETMAEAAANFEKSGFDAIDLNFACPAPKVLRRGRGGALMQKPAQIFEIYKRVRDAVSVPLTIKIRSGFDNSEQSREKFLQICDFADREQINGVMIHGRSVVDKYRGHADWGIIKSVKEQWPGLTVIGSGDVFEAEKAKEVFEESKVDGFIAARGAIGNPWLFSKLRALFENRDLPSEPNLRQRGEVILEHFDMLTEIKVPHKATKQFRKFAASYCKPHPERKAAMLEMLKAQTAEQLRQSVKKWFN